MDFKLNNRQREILGLLNDVFRLGVPPEEISTLKGAARIYVLAQDMKISALHDLGIAKLSLEKIGATIRRAGGTVTLLSRMKPPDPDLDDEGVGYGLGLDFMLEGI